MLPIMIADVLINMKTMLWYKVMTDLFSNLQNIMRYSEKLIYFG